MKKFHGRSRRIGSGIESLENRNLCAVGMGVTNGALLITGDGGHNMVRVNQDATRYLVSVGSNTPVAFAKAGVQRIEANLGGGNDNYVGNVNIPQTLRGDAGNDTIQGGTAADRIFGDIGFDVLRGAAGNDLLNGGANIDWMNGGAGADRFEAADGGNPDRLVDVTNLDSVHGDVINNVSPSENLEDRTNTIAFFASHVRLEQAQGPNGIFYRVKLNNAAWNDLYRAANVITIFTPMFGTNHSVTIDPTLRSQLEAKGWLNDDGKLA